MYNLDNNITSIITAWISWSDTQITVKNWEWAIFPSSNTLLTLEEFNSDNKCIKREIVEVTARSWDTLTIDRAVEACIQDDTAWTKSITNNALTFNANALVSLYATAWVLNQFDEKPNAEKLSTVDADLIKIYDSENSNKPTTIKVKTLCDKCNTPAPIVFNWANDYLLSYNNNTWTAVWIQDVDLNKYYFNSLKNADWWTSWYYFLVITKTDKDWNILLEKTISPKLDNYFNSWYSYIYNNNLYIIWKEYSNWKFYYWKFDFDLNALITKEIDFLINVNNTNFWTILDETNWYIYISWMDKNASANSIIWTINLSDDTFSAVSASNAQRAMPSTSNNWIVNNTTILNNDLYFWCYYSKDSLLYNNTQNKLISCNTSDFDKADAIWDDWTNIIIWYQKNIAIIDPSNYNVLFAWTLEHSDWNSREIWKIFYDVNSWEYSLLFELYNERKILYIIMNSDYTIKWNVLITPLINTSWLVNNIIKRNWWFTIHTIDKDTSEEILNIQREFVEWTYQDWNCVRDWNTWWVSITNLSVTFTDTTISTSSKTPTITDISPTLSDTTNTSITTCNVTI